MYLLLIALLIFPQPNDRDMACSPHEEYITTHFSGMQKNDMQNTIKIIGFLWCWNYMITKRWKTNVTGDEHSMRKIMEDFKAFCSNDKNRLREFWDIYETWTGWPNNRSQD